MLFFVGVIVLGGGMSLVLLKVNDFFYFLGKFKLGGVRLLKMGGLEVVGKVVLVRFFLWFVF